MQESWRFGFFRKYILVLYSRKGYCCQGQTLSVQLSYLLLFRRYLFLV
jgi:hypothetical protein